MTPFKFINLTPHAVTVHRLAGDGREPLTFNPAGQVARVSVHRSLRLNANGIGLCTVETGDVVGLPEPEPNTLLIVSAMVRERLPHRADLVSPGEAVRNLNGVVIGCFGLDCNPGIV